MMRLLLSLLLSTGFAFAADPAKKEAAADFDVPGGDIFGFTSPTDVGNKGDKAVAFEYSARLGKWDGAYYSGSLKNQYSYTVGDNLQLALSPFVTHHHLKNVTGFNDANALQFDGASGEIMYRVLSRSSTNRFAVTLSAEARYLRVDGAAGVRVEGQGLELKLFGDVDLGDNFYAATNLTYGFGSQKGLLVGDMTTQGAGTNASFGVTKKYGDFFFGVELRHLRAYEGYGLNNYLGSATFFGPTFAWTIDKTTQFNAVYTPQIYGTSQASGGRLDLDSFEKHQFRVKLVKAF